MSREKTAGLLHFGRGGHSIEFLPTPGSRSTLSGYDSPELFLWELNERGKYAGSYILPDGCPAIDVRAAVEQPGGVSIALRAPLADLEITDEAHIERLNAKGSIMAAAMMDEPGNQYGQMLRAHAAFGVLEPDEPGPLDRVSVARYFAYWRKHGARIGTLETIDGRRILRWENGTTTEGSNPYAAQWAEAEAKRAAVRR